MKLQKWTLTWLLGAAIIFTGCENKNEAEAEQPIKDAVATIEENLQATNSPLDLDDTNFKAQTATGTVLVDFWATWCPPCRTQGPIIDVVAKTLGDKAKVIKVDVDKAPETAKEFKIQSIPTLVILKDGAVVKTFSGVTQADKLVEAVEATL